MAKTTPTDDAAQQAEPLLICEVITHGIIIDGAHHAAGKTLPLSKARADALAAMTPPAVKVVGIQ